MARCKACYQAETIAVDTADVPQQDRLHDIHDHSMNVLSDW